MGKTSTSSQGCAPALAGQPKIPAVRWSRLCNSPLPAPCLPLAAVPAQGHPSGCCCCPGSSQPRANSRLLLFYTQRCAPVQTAEGMEASRARQCLEMPSGQPAAEATAHTHPTSEPSPSRAVGVSPKGGDTKRGSVPSASLGAGEQHQVLQRALGQASISTLCLPRGTDRRGRLSGARTPGAGGQLKAAPPHSSPLPTTHVQQQRELSSP